MLYRNGDNGHTTIVPVFFINANNLEKEKR